MQGGNANGSVYQTQVVDTTPIDGVAVSGTNTYYSIKTNIQSLPNASYTLDWTGTPNGTFTVQVSNKPYPKEANDTDWKTLDLASPFSQQPAGSASVAGNNDYVAMPALPFRWVRLKYVNASGSGTIFAWVQAKP